MSEAPRRPDSDGPAIHASAGIAELGKRVVVHGKDLHAECMELGFVGYTLFSVAGRTFPEAMVRVFEEYWVATGYPDARIWCNRIAGYLASARVDAGLALSAAIAASNSVEYGFQAIRGAYTVQEQIPEATTGRAPWLAAQLGARRILHGYGRPIHRSDERIAVALRTLARHGFRAGPALKRAFWLDAELRAQKGVGINILGVWAATAIDFGIDRNTYDPFMLLMFIPGYLAVYADQRARPALSFLPGHQSVPR